VALTAVKNRNGHLLCSKDFECDDECASKLEWFINDMNRRVTPPPHTVAPCPPHSTYYSFSPTELATEDSAIAKAAWATPNGDGLVFMNCAAFLKYLNLKKLSTEGGGSANFEVTGNIRHWIPHFFQANGANCQCFRSNTAVLTYSPASVDFGSSTTDPCKGQQVAYLNYRAGYSTANPWGASTTPDVEAPDRSPPAWDEVVNDDSVAKCSAKGKFRQIRRLQLKLQRDVKALEVVLEQSN